VHIYDASGYFRLPHEVASDLSQADDNSLELPLRPLPADEVLGQGYEVAGSLVISMKEVESDSVWEVARLLQDSLKARRSGIGNVHRGEIRGDRRPEHYPVVLESRINKTYHTSSSQPFDRADAGIAKFDSPNYISGLPASLASLAVHPATPRAGSQDFEIFRR
jgi:hypothetical protein